MKVVLDTNVFIDALFNVCDDCKIILKRESKGEYCIIMSNDMNEELIRIIESLSKKTDIEDNDKLVIYRILLRALRRVEPIEPKTKFTKCSDRDDNMFFSCAIDGNADYIVSKDKHIHELKEVGLKNKQGREIGIFYPDEFIIELDKLKLVTYYNNR